MTITNVRIPDSGAGNQPDSLIIWGATNTGTLSNCVVTRPIVNKLENSMPLSTMAGFTITGCSSITSYDLSYSEGTWTPGFATWTTAPTVVSANYTKIGRQVTFNVYMNNGVCPQYATITGLPFTSDSLHASAVYGGSGAAASGAISGFIAVSSTTIGGLPALTQTGNYWVISGTYTAAA